MLEKFQKGGGGQRRKSPQFKMQTTLRQGGGALDFTFFPNSNDQNMDLILIIYRSYIGEIQAEFSTYIWLIYESQCNSQIRFWSDGQMVLVMFLQGSEGMRRFQISPHSNFFLNQVRGGGSSNINFFPNSKQSRKLWTFSTICDIFFMAPFMTHKKLDIRYRLKLK